jgi:hypothetical protein
MSRSKALTSLQNFTPLNHAVWIHEPASLAPSPSRDPSLILLVTWMNASLRNISKYTTGYQKLYPYARILVVTTSTMDAAFSTESASRARVMPALEILYKLDPNKKLLLHAFSNGGSYTATSLIAKEYHAKTGRSFPALAMVLDSCPGKAAIASTVAAFAVGLPKFFLLRLIGIILLRSFFFLYMLSYRLRRKTNLIEQVRQDYNSKALFDTETPRLYIYSMKDDLVHWQYVEEHADEARSLGYRVDMEKFQDTGHAAHLMGKEERYWGAVQRLWGTVS